MSVYVDTSAVLAVFDVDDPRHGSASKTWSLILESDEEIHTSNYVIVETMALLQSRFGASVARRFIDEMTPAVVVQWVNQPVHDAAVSATLASTGKSGPSLVDCVSFEIIRSHSIDRVFAYDKHFRSRGYRLVG